MLRDVGVTVGRRQQVKPFGQAAGHDGPDGLATAHEHIRQVVDRPVLGTIHHVQAAQPAVGFQHQDPAALACQGGPHHGADGGFSHPAFSRGDEYGFRHDELLNTELPTHPCLLWRQKWVWLA